jgi:hypothetical protein
MVESWQTVGSWYIIPQILLEAYLGGMVVYVALLKLKDKKKNK